MWADFELLHPATRGGMSVVWQARHRPSGRLCAIKRFPVEGEERERFLRQVQVRLLLAHPNILPMLDGGLHDGEAWIATPWMAGGALHPGVVQSWPDVLRGLEDVVAGLAHAHAAGVAHQDLKPDNVLMHEGRWVLSDFGISRQMHRTQRSSRREGSPLYVAPEQIRGEDHLLRPWTDLYALGAMTWHLVTGEPPFVGTIDEVLRAHLNTAPGAFRPRFDVPDHLEAALRVLLSKTPWSRGLYAVDALQALTTPPPEPAGGGMETWSELDLHEAKSRRGRELGPFRPPVPVFDPDVAPGLRARVAPAVRRHGRMLWARLEQAVSQNRPQVVEVERGPDMLYFATDVVRQLSAEGTGFTLVSFDGRIRRLCRFALGEELVTAAAIARAFGVPAWRSEEVARGVLDDDPDAAAELLVLVARSRPLIVLMDDVEVRQRLMNQEAPVLVLSATDHGAELVWTPEDIEDAVAEVLGHHLPSTSPLLAGGLRAALMRLRADWTRSEGA